MNPLTIPEYLNVETEMYRRLLDNLEADTHCCKPGIIQSFDGDGTVTVLLAIKEKVLQADSTVKDVPFPVIVDVPIIMPRAGGFAITMPIAKGDECLVIFGDIGIDWWWQSGGCQNKTQDGRRHDLSDGFAILGPWSKPRNLPAYSATSLKMGKEDGSAYIEITDGGIINMVGVQINRTASASITDASLEINENGVLNMNTVPYLLHGHSAVKSGSDVSGPVVP
jgi:hypothetical protein